MTTTLIFLAGVGAGCVLAMLIVCAFLIIATRKPHKETTKQNETTAKLMRERNDLDREKVELLRSIAIKLKP